MAAVLDALASYVQNMLMEMAKEEVNILLGVTGEIEKMGVKLRDLKNFLIDAERRNITDLSVQAWVKELRYAMYDATDIIDLCRLKAMEQHPSQNTGCFNPLLYCLRNPLHAHDIGRRIKKLNERLDGIKARSASFNFINLGSYEDRGRNRVSPGFVARETSWGLDESCLVGEKIEVDTRNLVVMLTQEYQAHQECRKIMVFAIVGVGGIGKTTLAQKIFSNDIIKQQFSKKLWLSVNQDINQTEILRKAIKEAGGDDLAAGNTKTALERALIEALKGHKTLIIMDDVWDHRVWEDVFKTPLVNASLAHGSRVLVTTRHDTVARGMSAEKPYHRINKLEPEDAWLLLKKQVVGNGDDHGQKVDILRDIGMQITAKCDGLPLAVKVMGGLLRQRNTWRSDWENVLNDSIWSISQMPEELNNAVYLSYQDLHTNLKPCFLHYALLPKSTVFAGATIVAMWISEGFVHGDSDDLEVLGKGYYNQLIERNLIEPVPWVTNQAVCNMHDVVRSFAQHVARDEIQIAHKREASLTNKLDPLSVIRLSLEARESQSNELSWSSLQAYKSLRTLILVGQIKINPGDSLLCFSCLRILHIENGKFDVLFESLSQLKHLRHLSIRSTTTSRLPENIVKMKFLQNIDLSGCKHLEKLPDGIGKLKQLRFLGLNDTGINNIPRGFDGLTNLRVLDGFPIHMDVDWCSLEELGPLNQLLHLRIRGLENVSSPSFSIKANLDEKVRLSSLHMSCATRRGGEDDQDMQLVAAEKQQLIEKVFYELCPPSCLETLGINGYFGRRLPRWMMSTAIAPLMCLRVLNMVDLPYCTMLPDGLCQLPCLMFLRIDTAPSIKDVGHEFICCSRSQEAPMFPRLRQLRFIGLVEWEEWEWQRQVQAMPVLKVLLLERCKLRQVPCGLAFHTRVLKRLCIVDVKNLSSLVNFPSVVRLEVVRNIDLEKIANFPKLQSLAIIMCPKMKILDGMPVLHRLTLKDPRMETLPGYLKVVMPTHLLLAGSLSLLTCMAAQKSCTEWYKFKHIQQVKAYAPDEEGNPGKWYVLHTRDTFTLETNISRTAIDTCCRKCACFPFYESCPIEECLYADKRVPLCLSFRWNAYRHLIWWFHQACLHCSEAERIASPSDQWIEAAAGFPASSQYQTRYGMLQELKEP